MPCPVPKLETPEATQLLLQSSSLPLDNNIESNPATLTLSGRLDGLPLAITIAGSFIRETGTSISEYLQYYTESWDELQSQSRPGRHYPQGNILQTWTISYNEIKKRNPNAAELLLLLSYFDNRDIWYKLVRGCCNSCSSGAPTWFKKTVSNGLVFKNTVRPLIEFSLVEPKRQEGSYTILRVVQDWCLHVARARGDLDSVCFHERALIFLGETTRAYRRLPKVFQRLLPHTNYIVREGWSDNKNITVFATITNIGLLYSEQHKLNKAEELICQSLSGAKEALGPERKVTLARTSNIGNVYYKQGKLSKAEEMYCQALMGYEKTLGPDNTHTLGAIHNMGKLYTWQVRMDEAEKMLRQALVGFQKKLDPNHMTIQGIIHNLVILYWGQGKLKEAEEMCHQVLAVKKKLLGPNNLSTLETVDQLAIVCSEQGKLKEAEEISCQALSIKEKTLGADHPSTLDTFHNLGSVYKDQNKLKEAEKLFRRALVGHIRVGFRSDHACSRITVFNVGSFYIKQGRLNELEEMYCQVLVEMENSLGPDHPTTLKVVDILDGVREINTLEDEEDKRHRKQVLLKKFNKWGDREQPGKWLSVESDGRTQQAATRSDAVVKPSRFHTWQVVFCAFLTALTAWFLACIFWSTEIFRMSGLAIYNSPSPGSFWHRIRQYLS